MLHNFRINPLLLLCLLACADTAPSNAKCRGTSEGWALELVSVTPEQGSDPATGPVWQSHGEYARIDLDPQTEEYLIVLAGDVGDIVIVERR